MHNFMESHLGRREEITKSSWASGEGEIESRVLYSVMLSWSHGVNIEGEQCGWIFEGFGKDNTIYWL